MTDELPQIDRTRAALRRLTMPQLGELFHEVREQIIQQAPAHCFQMVPGCKVRLKYPVEGPGNHPGIRAGAIVTLQSRGNAHTTGNVIVEDPQGKVQGGFRVSVAHVTFYR